MKVIRHLGTLLCTVVLAACGSKEATRFSTPEELKEAYQVSYEDGDLEAILAMVYWDDTPEEIKESYKWLVSISLGEHRFDKLEVVPLDSLEFPENLNGEELEPTLTPTHWLVGSHSGNTGFEGSKATGTIQFAIGVYEERYFISGIRFKKKSAESGPGE